MVIDSTTNLKRQIKTRGVARGGGTTRGSGTSRQEAVALENVKQRHQQTRCGGAGEHEVNAPADKRGRDASGQEAVAWHEAEAAA